MSDCLFCKIAAGEIPSRKVYEDELCYAFYDIDPQAPVHFLMIPKAHISSVSAVDEENQAVVGHMFAVIAGLAKELKALAPFGKGNPAPLFGSKGIRVDRLDLIGRDKNILRMTLSEPQSGTRLSAISFDGYGQLSQMLKELYPTEDCDKMILSGQIPQLLDIVYSVDINTYNGRSNVQLMLKDFRFAK